MRREAQVRILNRIAALRTGRADTYRLSSRGNVYYTTAAGRQKAIPHDVETQIHTELTRLEATA